jgi:hypothetical protein
VDELACATQGLLGNQRHLFDRPTCLIQTPQGVPGQLQRGDQHPGLLETWVVYGDDVGDHVVRVDPGIDGDQVVPVLGAQGESIRLPGFHPVRGCGSNRAALALPCHGADQDAIFRLASPTCVGRQRIAPRTTKREMPAACTALTLNPASSTATSSAVSVAATRFSSREAKDAVEASVGSPRSTLVSKVTRGPLT